MDDVQPTGWDRVGRAAVLMLVIAFLFSAMSLLIGALTGESPVAAKRGEDGRELVAVEDDDDDDEGGDDGMAWAASPADDSNSRSGRNGSNSGSRSIGSNSGNTGTGTTRGTGVSRSVSNSSGKSKNTATGTTRGTGPSKTVSNSS